MKPIRLLLLALPIAATVLAKPIVLNDGAYQLIRARGPGGQTKDAALTAAVVNIFHKQGKTFIAVEGGESEVRTDDQQGFLAAVPYHPEEKGILASHLVFAGRNVGADDASPAKRVEGIYRIIWPGGEEKGEFALVPLSTKG
ncbi:MAG TPA: hypothetical protein VL069_05145 [Opitutus sp.]|nr:hypothetical protein [Opitutus sp.]